MAHFMKKVIEEKKAEVRGMWVNAAGTISYGLRSSGDVPADDVSHLEPCDRYAGALANTNAVRMTPEENAFLDDEVREIMSLAS